MWKKITKNFWIKLFCLISAAVLWIFVAASQNTVGKFPGSIKIKALNTSSGLVAIYDVQTVDIKIMADPTVWGKLSSDSFSAYVDLSNRAEGTYELAVNVVSSTPGVQIVERNPDTIIVRLEPIVTKDINVSKKVDGSVADGLAVGNIVVDPDKVQVKGPKSLVENLTEAIANIKLNGESEQFEKIVQLAALDEKGENIQNIEFNPSEVKVTVPIVKASNNKTVGVKVITSGAPQTGYYISNISVNPSVIDVIGDVSILSNTNYVETAAVDITNQNSTLQKEVNLDLKNGLTLQSGSPSKVKVKIEFNQTDSTKEVTATINPINFPTNYTIASYSQPVKVLCSGPANLIQNLKSNDVVLTIDFQGRKFSNDQETSSFDISSSSFKVPDGITVSSVLPSSLGVNLSKK